MNTNWGTRVGVVIVFFGIHLFAGVVMSADVGGLWTKTTDPYPDNVALFYFENNKVKVIGYSRLQERKILWFAEGTVEASEVKCFYHYSVDAMPEDWEQEGTMQLKLSDDGNYMNGAATSISKTWSGRIEFRRIKLMAPNFATSPKAPVPANQKKLALQHEAR